jgi:FkbM family methyltransferase
MTDSRINTLELLSLLRRKMGEVDPRTPGMFRFPWGNFSFPSLGTFALQFEEIYHKRAYEFVTDNPSPRIVDCGGNMGMSALWFKQNYPGSKVTIVEPDPELADTLEKNLAAAGVTGWSCLRAAVSYKDGEMGFERSGHDTGKLNSSSKFTVRTVDVASLLHDETDLLKLDIEGAEFDVIRRLCDSGAISRVKCLSLELHLPEGDERLPEVLSHLSASGMRFFIEKAIVGPFLGPNDSSSPFTCIGKNNSILQVYAWRKPLVS